MADTGTYRKYVERDPPFGEKDLAMIANANAIIGEYEPRGLKLTLRQLYYQFVARELFANNNSNYNKLKRVMTEARLGGLVSWTAIEDRGRNLMGHTTYKDPKEAMAALRARYKRDLWAEQAIRPEVWVEKQALEGVVGSICDELRVDFFATKGYNSQSEQWAAGVRFASYIQRGQRPVVFHLGDHDPSGLDMTRDNEERLSLFAGVPITVIRLGMNLEQIEELRPPPNPAKHTDGRFEDYAARYFPDTPLDEVPSWELDAFDPAYIHDLIRDAVTRFRDEAVWSRSLAQEAADKNELDIAREAL